MTPKSTPSILIYGGGSIGAACAYLLSKSVPEKTIYAVCRSNYEVASRHGFTINSEIWGLGHGIRPNIVRSVQEAVQLHGSSFDYILVTTKAVGMKTATEHPIQPALTRHSTIVIIQNGVRIEDPFRRIFPENPIVSVVMYTPLTQTAPGVFYHHLLDNILLGTFPSQAPLQHKEAAERLCQMFSIGGAKAKHEEDIQAERWKKLLINASLNPICALANLPDARFLQTAKGATKFARDVMVEVAATARAAGYEAITDDVVESQLRVVTSRKLPGVEPSMMADAISRRQMEADALLGNVMDIAKENDVEVPIVSTLYYLVNGLNHSFGQAKG
ncbi:2-dehydropantoate 2-reductase [Thelonectria olida]|uniref:2-dehydropantoate 2-reductase n=1 Tax=Thelonectria olida TaxID=1576542 RepID=A0A9P9AJG0_9HYPO|nr:2-dehydropantoate 2-reductase [Thelonectria olida]